MIYLNLFFYYLIGDIIGLRILNILLSILWGQGDSFQLFCLLTPIIQSLSLLCSVLWRLSPVTCISQPPFLQASGCFNQWESQALVGGLGRGGGGGWTEALVFLPHSLLL